MKKILLSAIGLLGLTMSFAQSPIIYEVAVKRTKMYKSLTVYKPLLMRL